MNLLNRIMSYDKTKLNQENCNCEEYVENVNIFEKNETVGNFKCADDFLRKIENYQMMYKEREMLNIMNLKYWYKDVKTKTFIWRALHIHGNKYDYSNTIYIKARENVEIICKIEGHKSFPQTPDNHLKGKGCKLCGIERRANKRRMTLEEFIEKARKIHGNKYDYSKVNYINAYAEVIIICPIHGDFKQEPTNHLSGCGCLKCGIEKLTDKLKLTLEEFIEKANEVHGEGRYDYSKVKYIDMKTEIWIICHNHDRPYKFHQRPDHHLSGHGCKKCMGEKLANERRLSLNEFVEESNKVHGEGTYDYSKVNYVNYNTDVIIICPIHGEFPQTPRDHLGGCGCSKCNKNKGEDIIRKFLTDRKIEFEEQKSFEDCRYINKLRFDFYLPKYNLCIESDGIPHFEKVNWNGKMTNAEMEENLKLNQLRDKIKNDYCKNNSINLLRIRYDEDIKNKFEKYLKLKL